MFVWNRKKYNAAVYEQSYHHPLHKQHGLGGVVDPIAQFLEKKIVQLNTYVMSVAFFVNLTGLSPPIVLGTFL